MNKDKYNLLLNKSYMIGLILGFRGTFFEELNNSITKDKTKKYHHITI
jgi:hypothetical protein